MVGRLVGLGRVFGQDELVTPPLEKGIQPCRHRVGAWRSPEERLDLSSISRRRSSSERS